MELEQAQNAALDMLEKHGLREDGWSFRFNRATQSFGICKHLSRVVLLSAPLVKLNTPERVQLTIIHEVAHALTPGHHHDIVWKAKCIELGGNGKRCFDDKDTIAPPPNPVRALRRNARRETLRQLVAAYQWTTCKCPPGYHTMFVECRGY